MLKKLKTPKKKGFTLVEILIVLTVIVVLSTLAIISLNASRIRGRDSKRIADIYHILGALEMYYLRNNSYPTMITPGQAIGNYMASMPSNPSPRKETACSNSDYYYYYSTVSNRFAIGYCLGTGVGRLPAGLHIAVPESITQSGLVGWWRFDENNGVQTCDASGNFAGTINGATWSTNCRLGGCLSFDGYNDYVGLSNLTPTGVKTIVAWIYVNDITNNHQAIFGNHLAQLHANDGLSYKSSSGYTISSGQINEQEWTQVAFVFDQTSSQLRFYINGENAGNSSVSDFSITANTIGILEPGSGNSKQPFNGLIDDVRLYDRALPDFEIAVLYNASKN